MKLLACLLAVLPSIAFATGGTVPAPKPVQKVTTINKSTNANSNASAVSNSQAYGGYVSESGNSQATGGSVAVTTEAARIAVAPDVLAYPTSSCRNSVGVSGGWIGGAFGVSGSTENENCEVIELSRHFHNIGQKEASIQSLCLLERGRKVLEATGTKCLLKPDVPADPVRP